MYNEDANEFNAASYQNSGVCNINLMGPWDSRKTALALFTVNQDGIIDELKSRFELEKKASWKNI